MLTPYTLHIGLRAHLIPPLIQCTAFLFHHLRQLPDSSLPSIHNLPQIDANRRLTRLQVIVLVLAPSQLLLTTLRELYA